MARRCSLCSSSTLCASRTFDAATAMIAMDAMIGSFVGAADIPVSTHTRAKRASSACPHKSAFCKRGSVNVRFAPKATEVLRCREWRGCGRPIRDIQLCRFARSANAAVFAGMTREQNRLAFTGGALGTWAAWAAFWRAR